MSSKESNLVWSGSHRTESVGPGHTAQSQEFYYKIHRAINSTCPCAPDCFSNGRLRHTPERQRLVDVANGPVAHRTSLVPRNYENHPIKSRTRGTWTRSSAHAGSWFLDSFTKKDATSHRSLGAKKTAPRCLHSSPKYPKSITTLRHIATTHTSGFNEIQAPVLSYSCEQFVYSRSCHV